MEKDVKCEDSLCSCLYFASNKLNRLINKMADEEFSKIGLSTSHAFALMSINTEPGLSQNELSKILNIKPSTTSRFIDKLEIKGLATRKAKGKVSYLYPTEKGESLSEEIEKCWHSLYQRYSKILGQKEGDELTALIYSAAKELDDKFQEY
jgi:DNA-binding MarR family transcriptional regulator